jgi:hypothetical protein
MKSPSLPAKSAASREGNPSGFLPLTGGRHAGLDSPFGGAESVGDIPRLDIYQGRKGMRRNKILLGAVALIMFGTATADAANTAAVNRQFRSAVADILNSVKNTNDFLRQMGSSEFRDFIACAQNVMDSAPVARKQYVLAAPNVSTQRQRFDEVALDNQAVLKQRITRECA